MSSGTRRESLQSRPPTLGVRGGHSAPWRVASVSGLTTPRSERMERRQTVPFLPWLERRTLEGPLQEGPSDLGLRRGEVGQGTCFSELELWHGDLLGCTTCWPTPGGCVCREAGRSRGGDCSQSNTGVETHLSTPYPAAQS